MNKALVPSRDSRARMRSPSPRAARTGAVKMSWIVGYFLLSTLVNLVKENAKLRTLKSP